MVPSLAVLRAAAQVGYRVDAARIEPGGGGGGEGRRDGDVEPAVGIEQGVVVAVELGALAQGDEDRDLGAVLGRIEERARLVLRGVERGLRRSEGRQFLRRQIIAKDAARPQK